MTISQPTVIAGPSLGIGLAEAAAFSIAIADISLALNFT
jgi:hypothetical protein